MCKLKSGIILKNTERFFVNFSGKRRDKSLGKFDVGGGHVIVHAKNAEEVREKVMERYNTIYHLNINSIYNITEEDL